MFRCEGFVSLIKFCVKLTLMKTPIFMRLPAFSVCKKKKWRKQEKRKEKKGEKSKQLKTYLKLYQYCSYGN